MKWIFGLIFLINGIQVKAQLSGKKWKEELDHAEKVWNAANGEPYDFKKPDDPREQLKVHRKVIEDIDKTRAEPNQSKKKLKDYKEIPKGAFKVINWHNCLTNCNINDQEWDDYMVFMSAVWEEYPFTPQK